MPQCVAIWRRGGATKKFNLVEAKSDTMKIFGANAFHGYTAINADTLALDNPNAIQNSPAASACSGDNIGIHNLGIFLAQKY
jgi:hypothetical protein